VDNHSQILESQRNNRYRLKPHEIQVIKDLRSKKVNRLVVGDVHLPYTHRNYLQHAIDTYHKYNCNAVSFTGDLIDSHFASFHHTSTETDGKYELTMAIEQIKNGTKHLIILLYLEVLL